MFSPLFLPSEVHLTGILARAQTLPTLSVLKCSFTMPVVVMSAQDETEFISKLQSTLGAILEEKGIRRDVQAALSQLEVRDCETFALLEGTADKLREWLHSEVIGLERKGADKVQAAKVVAAWEAAVVRTSAQRALEAEQRSAGLPAVIPGGTFVTMRKAWETQLEKGQTLSPAELPAKSFLEWRNAQVDDGEFLTESLAEVASQQEEGAQTEDSTHADFVREGSKAVIRVRRARARSVMPQTTEQLRHKYRLLAVHWGVLSQRYPNKHWSREYDPATLRSHVDWLLGDNVAELRAVTPSGEESVSPAWSVIVRYELEVRKEAMRQLNMNGVTLAEAFAAGRRSDELRTRYLVTLLALGGTQRRHQEARPEAVRPNTKPQQQNQAQPRQGTKRKQTSKDRRAAKRQEISKATQGGTSRYASAKKNAPDSIHQRHNGKSICFAYQTPAGCSRGEDCWHQHICAHCFGPHSFERCPNPPKSRAAYLKKRLINIKLARRSHTTAVRSQFLQEKRNVGVPTRLAVLTQARNEECSAQDSSALPAATAAPKYSPAWAGRSLKVFVVMFLGSRTRTKVS